MGGGGRNLELDAVNQNTHKVGEKESISLKSLSPLYRSKRGVWKQLQSVTNNHMMCLICLWNPRCHHLGTHSSSRHTNLAADRGRRGGGEGEEGEEGKMMNGQSVSTPTDQSTVIQASLKCFPPPPLPPPTEKKGGPDQYWKEDDCGNILPFSNWWGMLL